MSPKSSVTCYNIYPLLMLPNVEETCVSDAGVGSMYFFSLDATDSTWIYLRRYCISSYPPALRRNTKRAVYTRPTKSMARAEMHHRVAGEWKTGTHWYLPPLTESRCKSRKWEWMVPSYWWMFLPMIEMNLIKLSFYSKIIYFVWGILEIFITFWPELSSLTKLRKKK